MTRVRIDFSTYWPDRPHLVVTLDAIDISESIVITLVWRRHQQSMEEHCSVCLSKTSSSSVIEFQDIQTGDSVRALLPPGAVCISNICKRDGTCALTTPAVRYFMNEVSSWVAAP